MNFLHVDVALQQATRLIFNVPLQPDEKRMLDIVDVWAPW